MNSGQAELDQIRDVLIGGHLEELAALRAAHEEQLGLLHARIEALETKIDVQKNRAELVGDILPKAVSQDRPTGVLGEALQPDIEHAIGTSARGDSSVLAEALYPVLGPAMRKMIAAMLTPEALMAGKTFNIEQLLLIERETGLVLAASANNAEQLEDADVISGMMDAIRRFVQDAFDADDHDGLRDLRVGDTTVLVEWGPKAVLAAVVKGVPDDDFRTQSAITLEAIHRDYYQELESFSGDIEPFAGANEELSNFQVATIERNTPSRAPLVLAVLLGLIIIGTIIWIIAR